MLLIATRSKGKRREIQRLFGGTGIDIAFPDDVNVVEAQAEEALEFHDSFAANARAKAEYFCRLSGLATVADDSGLEVFSLGGEPGVRSKRWAQASGPQAQVDAANNAMLIRRLAGATENRRRARYRCVLALMRNRSGVGEFFEGTCTGIITTEPRGEHGFGYDPYFMSDDLGLTFGEASEEEKDLVSHRGNAFRALIEALTVKPIA